MLNISLHTRRGAIRDARVIRFSGRGPAFTFPTITNVSPLGTSFTVPRSHPVAISYWSRLGEVVIVWPTSYNLSALWNKRGSWTAEAAVATRFGVISPAWQAELASRGIVASDCSEGPVKLQAPLTVLRIALPQAAHPPSPLGVCYIKLGATAVTSAVVTWRTRFVFAWCVSTMSYSLVKGRPQYVRRAGTPVCRGKPSPQQQ